MIFAGIPLEQYKSHDLNPVTGRYYVQMKKTTNTTFSGKLGLVEVNHSFLWSSALSFHDSTWLYCKSSRYASLLSFSL